MHEYGRHPTHDGRTLRLLTRIEEYTRECLVIRVERRMGSSEVIETLSDVMLWRGIPEHMRSDNGPEFIAQKLRQWLAYNLLLTRPPSRATCPLRSPCLGVSIERCC